MVKVEGDAAPEELPPPPPVDGYDDEEEETDSDGDRDGAPRGEPALKRGPWTPEEDARLRDYVEAHGEGNWNQVRINAGLNRCGKSCRLRWSNHLRPDLKKGPLNDEEIDMVLRMQFHWGNKWAKMAARLPGRTDNEIKNYWNTRYKRHKKARLPIYPEYLVSQASNQDLNFDTPEESHGTKRPNEFPQENILDLNLMLQYFDCRTFSKLVPMGEQVLCPSLLGSNSLSIDAMNTLKRLKFTGCIASDYNASPSFIQISDESEKAGCSTSFNYGMTENQLAPPGNAIISSHPIIDGKPSTSWTTQRPMKMELPSVQYPNYGLSNAWSCDCPSGSPVEQAEADTLIEPPPVSLKSGSISSQITGLDAIVHKGDAIEDPKMSQGVFDVSLPPFSCNQVLQSDAYTMWHSFPSVPLDDEIDGCPLSEIQSSKSPSSSDAIFAESKFYPDSTFTGKYHSSWADLGMLGASLEASLLNDGSLFSEDHPMSIYNPLIDGDSCEEAKLSTTCHGLDSPPWNSMPGDPGDCNMSDFPDV